MSEPPGEGEEDEGVEPVNVDAFQEIEKPDQKNKGINQEGQGIEPEQEMVFDIMEQNFCIFITGEKIEGDGNGEIEGEGDSQ